jgi:hypothetical protein
MVPIVAGLLMGAAMGGGIAALQKKDILQGALMGGIGGALGGAFMPAAGGIGGAAAESSLAGTLAGEAGVQSLAQGSLGEAMKVGALDPVMLESGTSGLQGAAMEVGGLGIKPGIATGAIPPATTGGVFGNLGGSGGIGNFLSQNKYALAGGVAGGMMAPNQEPEPADQGNIYTTQFSQEKNPNFGGQGENYFSSQAYAPGTYTPVGDYKPTQMAANGGIIALAEGGGIDMQDYGLFGAQPGLEMPRYSQPVRQLAPEVAAYNQQMMGRANQQYNINARPGPMQVAGFDKPGGNSDTDWLNQQYQQAFGRDAEAGGRQTWEQALAGGKSKEDIFNEGILGSSEYKQQQANLAAGRTAYTNADGSHMYPDLVASGTFNPNRRAPVSMASKAAPNKATASDSVSGLRFNPQTQKYEGEFVAPGKGKKSDADSMREELNQMKAEKGDDTFSSTSRNANGGLMSSYAGGGLSSLGSYSDGGQLLKGPGDGVSDSIPARIGARQPARLADGEFVVPARIVSELGNGSTDAGAKRLYAMMDRVQKNRKKSIGKGKVAVDSKSSKLLPA